MKKIHLLIVLVGLSTASLTLRADDYRDIGEEVELNDENEACGGGEECNRSATTGRCSNASHNHPEEE